MEKKETIQSAPEIKNVSGVFMKFQSLPGNGDKTMEDFYSLMSSPCIERTSLLADLNFVVVTSENIVRTQFEL